MNHCGSKNLQSAIYYLLLKTPIFFSIFCIIFRLLAVSPGSADDTQCPPPGLRTPGPRAWLRAVPVARSDWSALAVSNISESLIGREPGARVMVSVSRGRELGRGPRA